MKPWHDSLLKEYEKGRDQLKKMVEKLDDESTEDKSDIQVLNYAIRDMSFIINWLSNGMEPTKPKTRIVHGVNGYWDESIGAFVDLDVYKCPYQEVEDRIDRELEEKRREASRTYRKSKQ